MDVPAVDAWFVASCVMLWVKTAIGAYLVWECARDGWRRLPLAVILLVALLGGDSVVMLVLQLAQSTAADVAGRISFEQNFVLWWVLEAVDITLILALARLVPAGGDNHADPA